MSTAPQVIYEFGPFRIDPDRETLLRDGQPLAITPKAFEVLLALVRRSHEVVAKDELLQAVWPGRVVEEANLSQCIFVLRKLLGDTPDARRYIVTLPGKGYRFAAPVRTLAAGDPGADAASPSEPPGMRAAVTAQPAEAYTRSAARKLVFGLISALIVIVGLLVSGYFVRHGVPAKTAPGVPAKSIAVLPFENLSNDKDNEYFVAGMQDLILTKLADIGGLKVIASTSTAKYASHPETLKRIAQQLGVASILEGDVQKVGNQVLINVQLIDTRTDSQIWAQTYQRTLDNVFGVEGEVAQKVTDALRARLTSAETSRLASVMSHASAANLLFLRAEYLVNMGDLNYDTASMAQAIPLYRQAVEKDRNFALAWARLSYTESHLAWFGGGGLDVEGLAKQARTDAARALKLAPNASASQIALGYSDYYGRLDYPGALKAFAAALAVTPNDSVALAATGYVLRRQNRFDAAIASLQQALVLDPRNSSLAFELGATNMTVSRYTEAEQMFQRALALDPNNFNAKVSYSDCILFSTGDISRALVAAAGAAPSLRLQRVTLLTWQRQYNAALALLDGIPDTLANFQPGRGVSKPLLQADLYRLVGDQAHARPLFAQALTTARAQLAVQQSIELAQVWQKIAGAELGLGHTKQALDAIAGAQAIITQLANKGFSPWHMEVSAALYAEAGRADLAVPLLAKALASPGVGSNYSPVLLWLDPAWDPIRHDPRFRVLLRNYAKFEPAAAVAVFDPPKDSLVVLPFTNLNGDPKQQYFSDGITEELTGALGQDTGLTVIAWETASRYGDTKQTPAEIGKALNVAHILDGSIQREGNEVRVSVELVNAVTGQELWSAHYDDSLENIFAVQDKITGAIAGALKVKFAGTAAAPTLNPQAHELYLKGLAALDRFTAADAQNAQNYFEQALKLDPNYADAWAELSYAYMQLSQISTLPWHEAGPKMRAAAQKALALDPRNAGAVLDLANVDDEDDRFVQARAGYRRALQLDPNDAHAHLDYGLVLPVKQSLAQMQEAARLDPDNSIAQVHLAWGYQYLGDWAHELAAAQNLIKVSPHEIDAAFFLAFAYSQLRRGEGAIKAFDRVEPGTARDAQLVDAGRLTYRALLASSLRPKAVAALDALRQANPSPNSQLYLLQLYLALGKNGAARTAAAHVHRRSELLRRPCRQSRVHAAARRPALREALEAIHHHHAGSVRPKPCGHPHLVTVGAHALRLAGQ